jgi:hypothetical protein
VNLCAYRLLPLTIGYKTSGVLWLWWGWVFDGLAISSQVFSFAIGRGVNLVRFSRFWPKLEIETGVSRFLVLENRNREPSPGKPGSWLTRVP